MAGYIGKTLRQLRKANALSVGEAAKLLSEKKGAAVASKTLYSWENGHRIPDADTFLSLCQLYGVSSLFGSATQQVEILPSSYEQLSMSGKSVVDHVIKQLLDLEQQVARLTNDTIELEKADEEPSMPQPRGLTDEESTNIEEELALIRHEMEQEILGETSLVLQHTAGDRRDAGNVHKKSPAV